MHLFLYYFIYSNIIFGAFYWHIDWFIVYLYFILFFFILSVSILYKKQDRGRKVMIGDGYWSNLGITSRAALFYSLSSKTPDLIN